MRDITKGGIVNDKEVTVQFNPVLLPGERLLNRDQQEKLFKEIRRIKHKRPPKEIIFVSPPEERGVLDDWVWHIYIVWIAFLIGLLYWLCS